MSFRVVFRRAAEVEFANAAAWYESQRIGLGVEFSSEVERAIEKVAESPTRYVVVFADIRRSATRRFPYSIYFRIRGDTVVVLAVFHGRRDPSVWQRRE